MDGSPDASRWWNYIYLFRDVNVMNNALDAPVRRPLFNKYSITRESEKVERGRRKIT